MYKIKLEFNISPRISNVIISSIILWLIIILFYQVQPSDLTALSPSFSRQEIIDNDSDWAPISEVGTCEPKDDPIIMQLYSVPNILAANYYSDGNTINGTIMLSEDFAEDDFLSYPFQPQVIYHMVIQPTSHYETPGRHAAVYADEIYSELDSGNWVRWIYEKFSTDDNRVIHKHNNYTGFFDTEKRFVSFSLDLNSITSPEEYHLSFGTTVSGDVNGKRCILKDDTGWYQIPIPQFAVSSSPML